MINIKTYTKAKKGTGSGSGGGSTTNITNVTNNNVANEWFEFDAENNAVRCKFDFYSIGAVSANGPDDATGLGFTSEEIEKLKALASKINVDLNGNVTITAYITTPA